MGVVIVCPRFPLGQQIDARRIQPIQHSVEFLHQVGLGPSGLGDVGGGVRSQLAVPRTAQHPNGSPQRVEVRSDVGLLARPRPVFAARIGDLAEVALAVRRDDVLGGIRHSCLGGGIAGLPTHSMSSVNGIDQMGVQGVHAGVVELGGTGSEHHQLLYRRVEELPVPLDLLAHIPQRVLAPAVGELVDHHEVGIVQHLDLLELGGGAVLARHDVHRDVGELRDGVVALTYAGSLDENEIELSLLHDLHDLRQPLGDLAPGAPRRHGAHVDAGVLQAVESDPITQQGAAGLALGGIHGNDGDPLVGEVVQEAPHEFVGETAFAGAAGAGQSDDGDRRCAVGRGRGVPVPSQDLGLGDLSGEKQFRSVGRHVASGEIEVASPDDLVDHALEAHAPAVFRRKDPIHAALVELLDLVGDDDPAATPVDLDVASAPLVQHPPHVLEELHVTTLIAGDRDALGVLLDGGGDDLLGAAIVAEVDDFHPGGLEYSAHHVDRRVVAVEEGGRCDDPNGVLLAVNLCV